MLRRYVQIKNRFVIAIRFASEDRGSILRLKTLIDFL